MKPRKHQAYSVVEAKYSPIETENDRVGTANAESPEAAQDDHGMAALKKRRARGGKVDGSKPRMRLDRPARHPDEAEDKALVKRMVKPEDLKKGYATGGAIKGKKGTTVNVIIAPQGGAQRPGMPAPPPGAMPPPTAIRPPPPNPVIAGQPGVPPQGMPVQPGMPPAPMRARGGSVHMTAGALTGEGRLQKRDAYGKNAGKAEK